MDDLTAFISARLDEDEAIARTGHYAGLVVITASGYSYTLTLRMLREIAAKRAIVALYDKADGYAASVTAEQAVAHLAAVWNDHPDYQQQWAP